jgi:hypothetical protein
LACDSSSHLILSAVTGNGPKPDIDQFRRVLGPALKRARIRHVVADAGYDSEAYHEFARDLHGVFSHIPPKHGRPGLQPTKGRYRRLMRLNFDASRYGQRSQAETVATMI